jgi:hypothetical protein
VLTFNGIPVPTPSEYLWGIYDISEAERNARGNMLIERINTKRKLELMWRYLGKSELQQLLELVSATTIDVSFQDPQTGTVRTGTFYCGDRTVGALDYRNGQVRWKDIKFNLIEC